MPGEHDNPGEREKDAVSQFLGHGLEEVSPPGGIQHRRGERLPRHRLVPDAATRTAFKSHLIANGATDIQQGADEMTVWWKEPDDGLGADAGFVPPTPAGQWEPLESPAFTGQDEQAASARALSQAMADLLEYAKSTELRYSGDYTPDRFAQEIIGIGRVVDGMLDDALKNQMDVPGGKLDAKVDMYLQQSHMETCAALARDAEALFYDIQAHTAAVEEMATMRLVDTPNPVSGKSGVHSATSAAKAVYTQDPECRRHGILVRHAGRVKARALDLYAISRRRLRTAQKALDTFTGKYDDE